MKNIFSFLSFGKKKGANAQTPIPQQMPNQQPTMPSDSNATQAVEPTQAPSSDMAMPSTPESPAMPNEQPEQPQVAQAEQSPTPVAEAPAMPNEQPASDEIAQQPGQEVQPNPADDQNQTPPTAPTA